MRPARTNVLPVAAACAAAALVLLAPVVIRRVGPALGLPRVIIGVPPAEEEFKWNMAARQPVPMRATHVYPNGNYFGSIERGPGRQDVDITLPNGRRARYTDVTGMVWGAGRSVRIIRLMFAPTTWDAARKRADALIVEWGTNGAASLDAFDRGGLVGQVPGFASNHRWKSGPGPITVEIVGDSDSRFRGNWTVQLRFTFDPPAVVDGPPAAPAPPRGR